VRRRQMSQRSEDERYETLGSCHVGVMHRSCPPSPCSFGNHLGRLQDSLLRLFYTRKRRNQTNYRSLHALMSARIMAEEPGGRYLRRGGNSWTGKVLIPG
jgi:hypothetical protein